MDIRLLNSALEELAIVDFHEELIWATRFNELGDFELHLRPDNPFLPIVVSAAYLHDRDTNRAAVIEDVGIHWGDEYDATITGRFLESILDRRIVNSQTKLEGNFQNGIKRLITESIISPTDSNRTISNFVFVDSTDTAITSLVIPSEPELIFDGDNLLDAIQDLCQAYSVGFQVLLIDKEYRFSLYSGVVRNDIILSPEYETLIASNYQYSSKDTKNVAFVTSDIQEGEGEDRHTVRRSLLTTLESAMPTGIDRRETHVDASSLPKEIDDEPIPLEEYYSMMNEEGVKALQATKSVAEIDGESSETRWRCGVDYHVGDILQMETHSGVMINARVVEHIQSDSQDGITSYPTLASI